MFEKVNPEHPDKVADRIAGAIVDLAYGMAEDPKIAVEVLIGHGVCHVIAESSVQVPEEKVVKAVRRIAGRVSVDYYCEKQDKHLAKNQRNGIRCGDNGIFRGCPVTAEQDKLLFIARSLYNSYPSDGKYLIDGEKLIICQSCMDDPYIHTIRDFKAMFPGAIINPLGNWTGGTDVDTGATNRKLGSDMGDAVTGGGLHGKDLSKADVSVNIYAHILARELGRPVELSCAIGDDRVCGIPYEQIVKIAADYIRNVGGFEKLAEWGLIR